MTFPPTQTRAENTEAHEVPTKDDVAGVPTSLGDAARVVPMNAPETQVVDKKASKPLVGSEGDRANPFGSDAFVMRYFQKIICSGVEM